MSWWEKARVHFDCFISQLVIEEARAGTPEQAQKRLEALQGIPLVPTTSAAIDAARYDIEQKAMPSKDTRDAFRLALATVHGVDYLLTWNFTHLANAAKRPHLEHLNKKLGLKTPIICPPLELMDWKP